MVQKGTQKSKTKVASQKAAVLSKKNPKLTAEAAAVSNGCGDSETPVNSKQMDTEAGASNSHAEREEMEVDQTKNSEVNGGGNVAESSEPASETVKQPVKSPRKNAAEAANVESLEGEITEKVEEKSALPSSKTKGRRQKETQNKMETDEQAEAEEQIPPQASRSRKRKAPEVAESVKPKERKVSEEDETNEDSAEKAEVEEVAEPAPQSSKTRKKKAAVSTEPAPSTSKSAHKKADPSVETKLKRKKGSLKIPTLKTISGKVFVIGENDVGQLGLGEDVEVKKRPAMLELPYSVVDVAAGGMHSVCLTESGEVITFGCNDEGALGRITTDEGAEFAPRKVEIREKVVQVSAGDSHSAALTESGQVYLWGNFRSGDGPMGLTAEGVKQVKPIRILNDVSIVKIASGTEHLACLSSKGMVYTMGCGENGQLGRLSERICRDGGRKGLSALLEPAVIATSSRSKPLLVEDIWCGSYATFLKLQKTNVIYAFGLNNYNHLGYENERVSLFPKKTLSFSNRTWLQITGGQHHTIALDSDNLVYALGRKDYGRLGLGENCEEKSVPTIVSTLENEKCCYVSCGNCVSFAITEDGSLYSWGMGTNHQLGHGNDDDCHVPHRVEGNFLNSWKAFKVSGGGQHTLILASPKESAKSDKKK